MAGMEEEEEEVCEESTLAEYMQRVEEEELVRHSPSFFPLFKSAPRYMPPVAKFLDFAFFALWAVMNSAEPSVLLAKELEGVSGNGTVFVCMFRIYWR